jgi:hypothetical protein
VSSQRRVVAGAVGDGAVGGAGGGAIGGADDSDDAVGETLGCGGGDTGLELGLPQLLRRRRAKAETRIRRILRRRAGR